MQGRWNGLAALLKRTVLHLSKQHCVAHREDLALTASWKNKSLLKNIKVLLRTVYTLFSQYSVKTAVLVVLASENEWRCFLFDQFKKLVVSNDIWLSVLL